MWKAITGIFTKIGSVLSNTVFGKRTKEEAAKSLIRDDKPSTGKFTSMLIHGTNWLGGSVIDKATSASKDGIKPDKENTGGQDVKQAALELQKSEAAEKENIVLKTSSNFKEKVSEVKINTLKKIDSAYRTLDRKRIDYDPSQTLMQNARKKPFRPEPLRKKTIKRLELNVGNATADIKKTSMKKSHAIDKSLDEKSRVLVNTVTNSVADNFEAAKAAQTAATESIVKTTKESHKSITENLQRVLESTNDSNENLNRNLAELYNNLQAGEFNNTKSLGRIVSENDEKLDNSISKAISKSDQSSNQAFQALSEQLYNNEVSFADSHKEEMTLLSKTKSGLRQLIGTVQEQKHALLAAGASVENLESKIAEVTQMPAMWGSRFSNFMEKMKEAVGKGIGGLIGATYTGAIASLAGIKWAIESIANTESKHPLWWYPGAPKTWTPFKSLSKYGIRIANWGLRNIRTSARYIGIDSLESILPQEVLSMLSPYNSVTEVSYSTKTEDIRDFWQRKAQSENKQNRKQAYDVLNAWENYGGKIEDQIKNGSLTEKAYAEGIKTLGFNGDWFRKKYFSSLARKSVHELDKNSTLEVFNKNIGKENQLLVSYQDASGRNLQKNITEDLLFHGINNKLDLFKEYLDSIKPRFNNASTFYAIQKLLTEIFSDPNGVTKLLTLLNATNLAIANNMEEFSSGLDSDGSRTSKRVELLKKSIQAIYEDRKITDSLDAAWYKQNKNLLESHYLQQVATDPQGIVNLLEQLTETYLKFNSSNKEYNDFILKRYNRLFQEEEKIKDIIKETLPGAKFTVGTTGKSNNTQASVMARRINDLVKDYNSSVDTGSSIGDFLGKIPGVKLSYSLARGVSKLPGNALDLAARLTAGPQTVEIIRKNTPDVSSQSKSLDKKESNSTEDDTKKISEKIEKMEKTLEKAADSNNNLTETVKGKIASGGNMTVVNQFNTPSKNDSYFPDNPGA